MNLKKMPYGLTVCKLSDVKEINPNATIYFLSRTDEEISLVCKSEDVPLTAIEQEDGWKGFYIEGVLDFSLVGILSKLSGILAENGIGIFAVSTYNTDYILVKQENFDRAMKLLADATQMADRYRSVTICRFFIQI